MSKFKLCLTGVSGIGKSSIIKVLIEDYDFVFSVSSTTRLKRPGEIDGKDYDFISTVEFEDMIEEDLFIEYTQFAGYYYGTPITQLTKNAENNLVFDLDPEFSSFDKPGMNVVVRCLLEHDDKEVVKQRLKARFAEGDKNNTLQIRLKQIDERVYNKKHYDFVVNVTNKTPKQIADEVMKFLIELS